MLAKLYFKRKEYSYPIGELIRKEQLDVQSYNYVKFNRLNKFLTGFDKIENSAKA